MRNVSERKSAWDTLVALFAALFNAIRQGVSSLTQYYRNLLASYGYNTSTYV